MQSLGHMKSRRERNMSTGSSQMSVWSRRFLAHAVSACIDIQHGARGAAVALGHPAGSGPYCSYSREVGMCLFHALVLYIMQSMDPVPDLTFSKQFRPYIRSFVGEDKRVGVQNTGPLKHTAQSRVGVGSRDNSSPVNKKITCHKAFIGPPWH